MKFSSYHPVINLIYFTAALAGIVLFRHPVFLAISFLAAFAWSVKLRGKRGLVFDLCLIPLVLLYAGIYASYNHFGVTDLAANFIGNEITLESIVYGLVLGTTAAAFLMMFSCFLALFSVDKIVYLFGKISPRLSLMLSVALRMFGRVRVRSSQIETARRGLGKGVRQGSLWQRMKNGVRELSILITWTLESFLESGLSMKSRGCGMRGRTAYSIYRFDNRDRSLVVVLFACLIGLAAALMLDQTRIYYDPEIIWNRVTIWSYVFYGIYAVFLLLPMGLECFSEWRFQRERKNHQF